MKNTMKLVGAVLLALALVGCGGDDAKIEAKDDKTSTTKASDDRATDDTMDDQKSSGELSEDAQAIADAIGGSDMPVGQDELECAAAAMADGLSPEGLDLAKQSDGDITDFTGDDVEVVKSALNDCWDATEFAGELVGAFAGSANLTLTDDETQCAADNFASGGAGDMLFSMSGDEDVAGKAVVAAVGPCLSSESLRGFMMNAFSQGGAMDDAVAGCIADGLIAEFGGSDLLEQFLAAGSGSMSADLESTVTSLTTECMTAG